MVSSPALKTGAVAMLAVLFAVQLLAATPVDGRVLPAARSLLADCVGDLCEVGCFKVCDTACFLNADKERKCTKICYNSCP